MAETEIATNMPSYDCLRQQVIANRDCRGLVDVVRVIEPEFMRLSTVLGDFYTRTASFAEQSADVCNFFNMDKSSPFALADRVLKDSTLQLTSQVEMVSFGASVIIGLCDDLKDLQKIKVRYIKLSDKFRMLSSLIMIQSANLGNEAGGFKNVGIQIGELAESLKHKNDSLIRALSQARIEMLGLAESIKVRNATPRKVVAGVERSLGGALNAVSSMLQFGGATLRGVGAEVDAISLHMGDLFAATQFHDIVRQQVEHIKTEYDAAQQALRNNEFSDEKEEQEYLFWVCTLQIKQLEQAFAEIDGAGTILRNGLDGITDGIGSVVRDIKTVSNTNGEEDRWERLETVVEDVISMLADSADIMKALGVGYSSVLRTLSQVHEQLYDMKEIRIEAQLLGLNASVQAYHIGDRGASLGVLAEQIQEVAVIADELIEETAAEVNLLSSRTKQEINSIQAEMSTAKKVTTDFDIRIHEAINAIAQIRRDTSQRSLMLERSSKSLVHDLSSIRRLISFPEVFHQNLYIKFTRLLKLRDMASAFLTEDEQRECMEKKNADQSSLYTMKSERDVHDTLVGGEEADGQDDDVIFFDTSDPSADDLGDDLDDNIELF